MTERRAWTGDQIPAPFVAPPNGEPLDPGTALGLWLDSIPRAQTHLTVTFGKQHVPPLTEEETAAIADYLDGRWPA